MSPSSTPSRPPPPTHTLLHPPFTLHQILHLSLCACASAPGIEDVGLNLAQVGEGPEEEACRARSARAGKTRADSKPGCARMLRM